MKIRDVIEKINAVQKNIEVLNRIELDCEDVHISDIYNESAKYLMEYIEELKDKEVKR